MAEIKDGLLTDPQVTHNVISAIERGAMDLKKINAIVIHQTHGFTAQSAINAWKEGREIKTKKGTTKFYPGAHFLIDRGSGTFEEGEKESPYKGIDGKIYQTARVTQKCSHVAKLKSKLYPTNSNSIGIELVARFHEKTGYPDSSVAQVASATWLVTTLINLISTIKTENLYAHGVVSREKKESEGTLSLEQIKKEIEKKKAEQNKPKISIHSTISIPLAPLAIDNTRVHQVYILNRFLNEDD